MQKVKRICYRKFVGFHKQGHMCVLTVPLLIEIVLTRSIHKVGLPRNLNRIRDGSS